MYDSNDCEDMEPSWLAATEEGDETKTAPSIAVMEGAVRRVRANYSGGPPMHESSRPMLRSRAVLRRRRLAPFMNRKLRRARGLSTDERDWLTIACPTTQQGPLAPDFPPIALVCYVGSHGVTI